MKTSSLVLALGAATFVLGLSACRALESGAAEAVASVACTSIEDLARKPADFRDKELCISGTVSEHVDLPFVDYDYFKVVRDAGGVWVQGPSPPPVGTKVVSTGRWVAGEACNAPLVEWVLCETERQTE